MRVTTSYNCMIKQQYKYKRINTGRKDKKGRIVNVNVPNLEKPFSINKKDLKNTYTIYRKALAYIIDVTNKEWDNIKDLDSRKKINAVENFIHSTDNNKASYDFDKVFYKFPSYFRRNAISSAIGKVSSYKSNYKNWEENGKKGNPPKLNYEHFEMPTFYRGNMYKSLEDKHYIELKLYVNNDWVWVPFKLRHTDIRYIEKYLLDKEQSNPTLVKKGKNYYLNFAYKEYCSLTDKDQLDYKILAVDLGLNSNAVMSVLDKTGTVYARNFVNLTYEKDQLQRTLNTVKKYQQQGLFNNKSLWRKVTNINKDISIKTARAIIDFAKLHKVDCIVFEHLDLQGKKHGTKKQQLHHWRCKQIQKMVELKAHQNSMRISRICAWGTSKLAFDGSGEVSRGKYIKNGIEYYNYSICTFNNGKQYNCDLNASYNIGARFFLRAFNNKYNNIEIKTPQRTLATLKDYYSNLDDNIKEELSLFS